MQVTRQELESRYREMADAELMQLASGNALTELAHDTVLAELRRRGLEPPPPPAEDLTEVSPPGEGALKPVGVFLNPIAAEALHVRLKAEGLSTVTHYANGGVLGNVGLAGVRVLVPESELTAAVDIHKAMEAGEFAIDENFDPDQPGS